MHRFHIGHKQANRRRVTRADLTEWATLALIVALLLFTGLQPRA